MRQYLRELFRWRDLLFWLAAKEIKVRYKMPLLGFLWALLVPLLMSGILWLIFSFVVRFPMDRYPYFLFLITGMFPWNFFSQSVSQSTTSVLDSGSLIRKTAFPRALIPLSIIAANGVNFLLSLLVVLVVAMIAGVTISRWIWLLPVAIALELVLTTGIALLVAHLQVRYRDVKYMTEIGLLLWFYLTPVFYPLELIANLPAGVQLVYLMNPFVGVVELFRLALLGGTSHSAILSSGAIIGCAALESLLILLLGITTFRRHESTFVDWVAG